MKILSVAVPCYNSEDYMSKCIDTLLESGDGIEIIIINDGSTDSTREIADLYMKKYPDKVRAIHQENSGHGGAVNTGIKIAQGAYFKVVDSDDWVNPEALKKVVRCLNSFMEDSISVDMFITDFVYDKVDTDKKKIMHYRGIVPQDKIIFWSEVGKFRPNKYILMHSVIYNMSILKDCGLKLPQHTFYVDNLFVYQPIPYVKNIYYMSECLYHYFIGRSDQSVNEANMIKRIDQQLFVNRLMMEKVDLNAIKNRKKRLYMLNYLTLVTVVSSVFLMKTGTDDAISEKNALWSDIREYSIRIYLKMRFSILGTVVNLPGDTGRKIVLFAYKQAQRRLGFN